MKSKLLVILTATALCFMATVTQSAPEQSSSTLDRTTLPIKEPAYPVITELDASKVIAPARFEVKPPAKAPNVVVDTD